MGRVFCNFYVTGEGFRWLYTILLGLCGGVVCEGATVLTTLTYNVATTVARTVTRASVCPRRFTLSRMALLRDPCGATVSEGVRRLLTCSASELLAPFIERTNLSRASSTDDTCCR